MDSFTLEDTLSLLCIFIFVSLAYVIGKAFYNFLCKRNTCKYETMWKKGCRMTADEKKHFHSGPTYDECGHTSTGDTHYIVYEYSVWGKKYRFRRILSQYSGSISFCYDIKNPRKRYFPTETRLFDYLFYSAVVGILSSVIIYHLLKEFIGSVFL